MGLTALKSFLMPLPQIRHFEQVLGTSLELQLQGFGGFQNTERLVLEEIERLEQIFSRFRENSELNRFLATQNVFFGLSPELELVLRAGLEWQVRSFGAFHLGADAFGQIWKQAEGKGVRPKQTELDAILEALKLPLLELGAGVAKRCSGLTINLNAIAKGFIADSAARMAALQNGTQQVLVNLGGDIRHCGTKPVVVSIANPFSSADNAVSLEQIQICNQGLATSGGSHRGFRFAKEMVSHLFDPRTGQPVRQVVAASVIAPDAMTADVLSTIFSVLEPLKSLDFANSIPNIGCCIVNQNTVLHNEFWKKHQVIKGKS